MGQTNVRAARFSLAIGLGIALSAGPGGCGRHETAPESSTTGSSSAPVATATPAKPAPQASPAECRKFADEFLQAVETGKLNRLNEKFNWPALLDRATAAIQAPPQTQKPFKENGARQAIDAERGFSAKLLETIKAGGKLKFLRVHDVDHDRRVMFRLVNKDDKLGYLDFVLGKNARDQLRIVDVDAAQDGQLLSTTIREAYLQRLADEQPQFGASLTGEDRAFFEAAPQLTQIAAFRRTGNFRRAMETFEQLPRDVQARKSFQRLHVAIAEGLGDKAYADALDEFRAHFPDDPSQNLLSADDYLRDKQYDKAAGCIHRLDQHVDDPYLDVMLARLYLQAGEPQMARAAADAAIRRAPRELESYEARLSVSLEEKNFDETARLLYFIGTRFGARFHDLKKLPAYAEFVKSPQYTEWLKAQAAAPQQANTK
jgi:tetratricopeptide (TPR) repeat protein